MSFLVVKCFNCAKVQVQEKRRHITELTFNCKYCGKTRKFHNKRKGTMNIIIYGNYENPIEATARCQERKRTNAIQ